MGDHVGDDPAAVTENRARVAAAARLPPPTSWVWLRQVHGAAVHVAERPTREPPEADAAVTGRPGLPLAVTTADCAPVVLACGAAVAVAHAGHRGILAGVIEATVERLRAAAGGPVEAFLGPCIRPQHYEFGVADLERVVARLGPQVAATTAAGRPALDLPAAVRVALARAGVEALHDCGVCTAASPHHFSHRRDGLTGRQVTVAVLT
ncbi:MAG: laccase domain protein [Acidimicrobiia bacterium]|nr:MAG: laccase domain protein [Acidimicrobiia bacterium]